MSASKALALGLAFACALGASAAFAHATLVKSIPAAEAAVAPPIEIRLTFSEGVEPRFSGLALSDAGGGATPLGAATLDPADLRTLVVKLGAPLKPGAYAVEWHAVSTDTHKTHGRFTFTVTP